jgi:pyridoxal phosphate enzyme (YggS family)
MSIQTPTPLQSALGSVKVRVAAAAAAAKQQEPRLVAVSKTKPVEDLMEAYEAGQRIFGENYAQELLDKAPVMPDDVVWHFIGHLQSNKANALLKNVPNLAAVETVDSLKLATKLSSACEAASRQEPLGIFIQVHTSDEDTKSGVSIDEAAEIAKAIVDSCKNLQLKGLMTIGAPGDFSCFDKLAQCRVSVEAALELPAGSLELSMGMSNDFEEAISRGSTNVRVGSTIFGARNYKIKSV